MKIYYYSLLYNLSLKLLPLRAKSFLFRFFYNIVFKKLSNYKGLIKSSIHGHKVIFNNGYTYNTTVRLFPNFNDPLIDLVGELSVNRGRSINIIDVGAAIGDTALLLLANLNDSVNQIHCIDGDSEFFMLLNSNLKGFNKITTHKHLLSSEEKILIPELVRIHKGTASAQGESKVSTITLDSLVYSKNIQNIDLLKIDVDGYDGEVLKGSKASLKQFKCPVIFELHPILLHETGNDINDIFETLVEIGYNRCYWFTKFGIFSHKSEPSSTYIDFYNKMCLQNKFVDDWHYDIIAIHDSDNLDIFNIIERKYSKQKTSFI
jgi:FkbM family methyltransferase